MSKKGTTSATADMMKSKSQQKRHGPADKNVVSRGRSAPKPTSGGRTAPIKGPDRGGV